MGSQVQEKVPFAPLARVYPKPALVADIAGVTERTVARWKQDGVPVYNADRLACWAGRHPAELWSDWYRSG